MLRTAFGRWRERLPWPPADDRAWGRLWGRAFAVAWLLFLAFAVVGVFDGHRSRTAIAAELATAAVFVALYLWHMFTGLWAQSERASLAVAIALAALASGLCLADGSNWGAIFIYVAVVAGSAFDRRRSTAAVFASALLAVAIAAAGHTPPWFLLVIVAEMVLTGMAMVGIGYLVTTNAELRRAREEVARLAVAEERLRFARDLHDLLGHSLSVIVLKSELAGRLSATAPERAAGEVRDVERVARDALREVREAVAGYRHSSLSTELEGARSVLAAAGVAVAVEPLAGPLPAPVDSTLAWAVREGVTNIIRHSRAANARVRLSRSDGRVDLELVDDGLGCDGCEPGSGLRGLRERAAAREGSVEFGQAPGGGFRLAVRLPLAEAPRSAAEAPRSAAAAP